MSVCRMCVCGVVGVCRVSGERDCVGEYECK